MSAMSDRHAGDFHLGDWLVRPSLNRLVRGGEEVRIEPKVMDLLVYLSGHGGEVVAAHRLVDEVWPYNVVARSALSRTVTLLRRALGDDAASPRYLETIPKRGYRLIATVRPAAGASEIVELHGYGLVIGGRWRPLVKRMTVLGRSPAADMSLDAPGISRLHARITVDSGGAHIEDLGSKNGTFLDGVRIERRAPLADGANVLLGQLAILFRQADHDDSTETAGR